VLLQSQVASGSAQLDFETGLDDTYDGFLFVLNQVAPAADDDQLAIRVKVGGAYQTTGYHRIIGTFAGSAAGANTNTAASGIGFNTNGSLAGIGNAASEAFEGEVRFGNPDASGKTLFSITGGYIRADGSPSAVQTFGYYNTAGAVTGIRFFMGSGNIASGRISLYGIRKA
jgi:hypothetical protein